MQASGLKLAGCFALAMLADEKNTRVKNFNNRETSQNNREKIFNSPISAESRNDAQSAFDMPEFPPPQTLPASRKAESDWSLVFADFGSSLGLPKNHL